MSTHQDIDDWIKMAYPPHDGEAYPSKMVSLYAGWLYGYVEKYGLETPFRTRHAAFLLYADNMEHIEIRDSVHDWYLTPAAIEWLNEYRERDKGELNEKKP